MAATESTDPVASPDSVWSLAILLGHSGAAWSDVGVALMLFVLAISLQVGFTWIVSRPAFLGLPFEDNKHMADVWRFALAHDSRFMDFQGSSLAARLCTNSPSLIDSGAHQLLLQNINSYLDLSSTPSDSKFLALQGMSPGVMLCIFCIIVWSLAIIKELRETYLSLEAIFSIPRSARTTFLGNRLESISWTRFLVFCAICVMRAVIASFLFRAGLIWLARTTSITDLILNAAALGAVIEVDELVFCTMMPKQIQLAHSGLEDVHLSHGHFRKQAESLVLILTLLAIAVSSYFFLLKDVEHTMLQVKTTLCGGTLDFVIGENVHTGGIFAFPTKPGNGDVSSLLERTVREIVSQPTREFASVVSEYATKVTSSGEKEIPVAVYLEKRLSALFEEPPYNIVGNCVDFDFSPHQKQLVQSWNVMKDRLGQPDAKSCQDLRHFCNTTGLRANMLRLNCPVTCKCDNRFQGIYLRTETFGCSTVCLDMAAQSGPDTPCIDHPVDSDWIEFVEAWDRSTLLQVATGGGGDDELLEHRRRKEQLLLGCPGIKSLSSWNNLCFGAGGSENAPLAYRCPVSCECSLLDDFDDVELQLICTPSCFSESSERIGANASTTTTGTQQQVPNKPNQRQPPDR
eukprot:TRINITY_DN14916_c0_g1_i2.p1 TRINITY_DN14916_c0_g1~~TRINITY_DN14916_c0_g1_i2.p1  ORF type:complete len:735 (-),score=98.87 TRINITY_DN14916_c0_g1_i2:265-2154(-)